MGGYLHEIQKTDTKWEFRVRPSICLLVYVQNHSTNVDNIWHWANLMLVHIRQMQYLLVRQITVFQCVYICKIITRAVVQEQQVGPPPPLLYIHSKSNL
jgi:hypothetical protein